MDEFREMTHSLGRYATNGTSINVSTYQWQSSNTTNLTMLNQTDVNGTQTELIYGIPDHLVDPNMLIFRRVIHAIDLYGIPVISVVGILGNLVCFLVFMTTYLRSMSSSIYLAALSICDAVFLLTQLFSWMNNVGIDIYHRPGWCQILTYLGFVTSFLDVWYVVSFTVERYLAVCFPLKRQIMCTPKRAKIVVVSLAILGCVLFNYALWTSEVGWLFKRPYCSPKVKYFKVVLALTNVDTLITLIIPTIIIVTCNIYIGYAVAMFYRNRSQIEGPFAQIALEERSSTGSTRTSAYSNSSFNRLQMKVTQMLLVVSSVFLLCHIPSHAYRFYAFILDLTYPSYLPSHLMLLIQKLFQYMYVLNFAVNFFLYSLSGKTFRRALMRLCTSTRTRVNNFVRSRYSLIRTRSRSSGRSGRTPNTQSVNVIQVVKTEPKCSHKQQADVCKVCEKYS